MTVRFATLMNILQTSYPKYVSVRNDSTNLPLLTFHEQLGNRNADGMCP